MTTPIRKTIKPTPKPIQKKNEPITIPGGEAERPFAELRSSGGEVKVSIGKTINIGDYQSIRVDYAESRPVNDGETYEQVREEVAKSVFEGFAELAKQAEADFSS